LAYLKVLFLWEELRISCSPAEIGTQYYQNTSIEYFSFTDFFGGILYIYI